MYQGRSGRRSVIAFLYRRHLLSWTGWSPSGPTVDSADHRRAQSKQVTKMACLCGWCKQAAMKVGQFATLLCLSTHVCYLVVIFLGSARLAALTALIGFLVCLSGSSPLPILLSADRPAPSCGDLTRSGCIPNAPHHVSRPRRHYLRQVPAGPRSVLCHEETGVQTLTLSFPGHEERGSIKRHQFTCGIC